MHLPFLGLLIACPFDQSTGEGANPQGLNVGFDLKFSYGTAAVSLPNGTVITSVRVDSGPIYQETFRKLSLWSSVHNTPPYMMPDQRWSDYGRQLKRRARKALGLPASDDVAALASLISALKEETERALDVKIASAAASLPLLPAVYDEDLYDAFEYAGLEYLQIIGQQYHNTLLTYETSAALAGHKLSICPNWTVPAECHIDDLQDVYYIINYENSSLFAYHTHARSAYSLYEHEYFDLELGHNARCNNPNEVYYWSSVRDLLLRPLLGTMYMIPTKVILVGDKDSIDDPSFRKVLNEVLEEFFEEGVPEVIDGDPEYVQAKGVAEFVRRRPYLPKPIKPEGVDRNVFPYRRPEQEQQVL